MRCNQATDNFVNSYPSGVSGNDLIRVYSVAEQELKSFRNTAPDAGINVETLAAGIYYLQVIRNVGPQSVQKFMKK